MTMNQPCPWCKRLVPSSHFIGVRGNTVKHCAGCRKQNPVVAPPPESHIPSPPRSPSLRRSRSLSFTASPTPAVRDRSDVASAASVVALETRLSSLEQSLDGKISELLNAFRASQPLAAQPPFPSALLPTSQAPQASQALPLLQALPPPPRPRAPPAVEPVLLPAGQSSITAGESAPLSITRCFAWVPLEVVHQVERDQLKPEHLVKLRNPELRVSKEPTQEQGFTLGAGGTLSVVQENADSRTSSFIKAIPNIAALAQHLIECDHLYTWRAVADYHLAVCRQRFGTGAVHEWSSYDPQISSRVLYPFLKTGHPSCGESSSGSRQPALRPANRITKAIAAGGSFDPCRKYNAGQPCSGCNRHHACLHCQHKHPMTQCPMLSGKAGSSSHPTTVKKAT
ncbi:uncharacterized protein MEPE_05961 [Melanopsichium pennsylvanicum]|uniref:Uncharacterized protein n=1 Tax=Melanopsichium pennsylvanicum TaxID=63383 RepID=A0AAJ4XSQ3_9BASI|nr:uncharacterized protein MEPE_05961 [Melanopsichium pennsylvanicum]